MLTLPVLSLLAFASTSFASPENNSNAHSHNLRRLHRSPAHARRASALSRRQSNPVSLADGSLGLSEGCTAFYQVPNGEYCIKVAQKFNVDLDDFYKWNTGVSKEDCPDLLAGKSYCVAGPSSSTVPTVVSFVSTSTPVAAPTTTSSSSSSTSEVVLATSTVVPTTTPSAVIAAAAVTSSSSSSSSSSTQVPTTTSSAPAAEATEVDEDEEDGECDADDEEYDDSEAEAATETTAAATTSAQVVAAAQPTTTSAAAATTSASSSNSIASTAQATFSKLGVKSLVGSLSGSLASWYNANSGTDSTNGHSWCGYPYSNDSPVFAPPIQLMMQDFGNDYTKAATAYCGLEAIITTPEGKTATLYIGDAFDMTWVRTTYAIDIMHDAFNTLFGKSTDNKNDVISGVTWELTGNVNSQWTFKSTGSG